MKCNIPVFVVDVPKPIDLEFDDDTNVNMHVKDRVSYNENDYNKLINKPSLNGVTIIGNMVLADLFPDGLIIDGGTAEGAE